MNSTNIKKNSLAAVVTASALALSACGSGAPEAQAGENGGTDQETIVVGTQPFAEVAPLHIAIQEGIFEDHGLDVELAKSTGGGAGLIPGMVAGDIDVVYSNYVSLLQGASKGLPLRAVRENDRPGVQALYVMPDSGITEPADLAGKTIAVNGLGNIMELTSRAVLESHGVTDAEFVEIPPPNMEAALADGQIDAAWLVEPFVTMAEENLGVTPVVSAFEGPTEDLPVAGWAVREDFVQQNPETVEAFVEAMDEAIGIAEEDPQAVKDALLSYTQIPEGVVDKLSPISFAETSDFSHLNKLNQLMVEYGLIDEPVDLDTFVADVQ